MSPLTRNEAVECGHSRGGEAPSVLTHRIIYSQNDASVSERPCELRAITSNQNPLSLSLSHTRKHTAWTLDQMGSQCTWLLW